MVIRWCVSYQNYAFITLRFQPVYVAIIRTERADLAGAKGSIQYHSKLGGLRIFVARCYIAVNGTCLTRDDEQHARYIRMIVKG